MLTDDVKGDVWERRGDKNRAFFAAQKPNHNKFQHNDVWVYEPLVLFTGMWGKWYTVIILFLIVVDCSDCWLFNWFGGGDRLIAAPGHTIKCQVWRWHFRLSSFAAMDLPWLFVLSCGISLFLSGLTHCLQNSISKSIIVPNASRNMCVVSIKSEW